MSSSPSATERQSAQALAHQLYTECNNEREHFRPLAKAIKLLRNELEVVDEVFGEATIRPENLRLLLVVGDSKEVLLEIEGALHHFRQSGAQWVKSQGIINKLKASLAVVTENLTDALEAWKSSLLTMDTTTPEPEFPAYSSMSTPTPSLWSIVPFGSPDPLSVDIARAVSIISQDGNMVSLGKMDTPLRHNGVSTPGSAASVGGSVYHDGRDQAFHGSEPVGAVVSARPGSQQMDRSSLTNDDDRTKSTGQMHARVNSTSSGPSSEFKTESMPERVKPDLPMPSVAAIMVDKEPDCVPRSAQHVSEPQSQQGLQKERKANNVQANDELETSMGGKPVPTTRSEQAIDRNVKSGNEPGHGHEHLMSRAEQTKVQSSSVHAVNAQNDHSERVQPAATPGSVSIHKTINTAVAQVSNRASLSTPTEAQTPREPPTRIDSVVSKGDGNIPGLDQAQNPRPLASHEAAVRETAGAECGPSYDQLLNSLKDILSKSTVSDASPPLGRGQYSKSPREEQDSGYSNPTPSQRAATSAQEPTLPHTRSANSPLVPRKPSRLRSASHELTRVYQIKNQNLPRRTRIRRDSQSSEDLYTSSRPSSSYVPRQRAKSCELPNPREIPDVVISPPTRQSTTIAGDKRPSLLEKPSKSPDHLETAELEDHSNGLAKPQHPLPADNEKEAVAGDVDKLPPLPPRPFVRDRNIDPEGIEVNEHRSLEGDKEVVRESDLSRDQLALVHGLTSRTKSRRFDLEGHLVGDLESENEARMDIARLNLILQYWDAEQRWVQAEEYLWAHLERQMELGDGRVARRIRHLLGVAASMQGQWHKALILFVSVLNKPITMASKLDAGDCAAAYWLGDTYALLNRRAEAVLSYALAECGPTFQDGLRPGLWRHIRAEQEECLMGIPRIQYVGHLLTAMQNRDLLAEDSILDPEYFPMEPMMEFLLIEPSQRFPVGHPRYKLHPNRSRAQSFAYVAKIDWLAEHRMQLGRNVFDQKSPWPMPYDPYFSIANVCRGRFFAAGDDLREVFSPTSAARMLCNGPIGRSRFECFTCHNLEWLIDTIRECLSVLGCAWTEVVNNDGAWFVARYPFFQNRTATINYFSIALFRKTLSGYGADICSGGIYSARVQRSGLPCDERGVPLEETKGMKRRVREYLDEAERRAIVDRDPRLSAPFGTRFRMSLQTRASSSALLTSVNAPVPSSENHSGSRNTFDDHRASIVYR